MQPEQPVWTPDELRAHVPPDAARLVVIASAADRVRAALPYAEASIETLPADLPWVVVAGGGTLIDAAKRWRLTQSPGTRLAALPTLWGSGAEASPVAVGSGLDKSIVVDDALRPDVRVHWPELGASVAANAARWACGDAWSHALEGFLSPLARPDVQAELAGVLRELLALPPHYAPGWYEASARACAGQARSSVGLVHGIAHVLEPALLAAGRPALARHARLCAAYLAPVLRFNLAASPKALARFGAHGLDAAAIVAAADAVGSADDVAATADVLRTAWPAVVRDRCTRTNVALVRTGDVGALLEACPV